MALVGTGVQRIVWWMEPRRKGDENKLWEVVREMEMTNGRLGGRGKGEENKNGRI